MAKIRIMNKRRTKRIDFDIKDPADARTLLNILAKNGVPCVLHGGKEKEETYDGMLHKEK